MLWFRLGIRILLTALALLVLFLFGPPLLSLFAPFVAALIVAAILNPLVRWVQRRLGLSRGPITLVILVLLFGLIGVGLAYLGYAAALELVSLAQNWSVLLDSAQAVLEQAIERAAVTGAAAPAVPVTDTVKRGENGLAAETVDRADLWAVQTPQVFEAGLIRAALEQAAREGVSLTDDCGAVERLGMKVSLTQGSRENIKITTPLDLILGEAILEARGRGEL